MTRSTCNQILSAMIVILGSVAIVLFLAIVLVN